MLHFKDNIIDNLVYNNMLDIITCNIDNKLATLLYKDMNYILKDAMEI